MGDTEATRPSVGAPTPVTSDCSAAATASRATENDFNFLLLRLCGCSAALTLGGGRHFAYATEIFGFPVFDLFSLMALAALAIRRRGAYHLLRSDSNPSRLRGSIRPWFGFLLASATVAIFVFENLPRPTTLSLRILAPLLLLWIASEMKLEFTAPQFRRLEFIFVMPLLAHLSLNAVNYRFIIFPEAGVAPLPLGLLFPQVTRGDYHGIIAGLAVLYSVRRITFSVKSFPKLLLHFIFVVYISISAIVRFDNGSGQWGLGSLSSRVTLLVAAVLVVLHSIHPSRSAILGSYRTHLVGFGTFATILLSFVLVTVASSTAQEFDGQEVAPPTTNEQPTNEQPTESTDSQDRGLDLREKLISGTTSARLDTWTDVILSANSIRRVLVGGNSSNESLLLNACGFTLQEYRSNSSVNKCAVDNGWAAFPLPFAHNWLLTAYLYFGVIGAGLLMFSLLRSIAKAFGFLSQPYLATGPLLFWVPATFGVIIWSPMSLSFFLFSSAVQSVKVSEPLTATKHSLT